MTGLFRPIARRLGWRLAALTILSVVAVVGLLRAGRFGQSAPIPDSRVMTALGSGVAVTRSLSPLPHWRWTRDGDGADGVAVLTDETPPSLRGYGGELGVLVALDRTGRIAAVKVMRHRETPGYLEAVLADGGEARMAGRFATDAFSDLDTVSGATLTSRALRDDVAAAARLAARDLLGLKVPDADAFPTPVRTAFAPLAAAVAALLLGVFATLRTGGGLWLRRVSLAAGFLVLGCWLNAPLSLAMLGRSARGVTLAPGEEVVLAVLIVSLGSVLLFGKRSWCHASCPFGAAQTACAALSPWRLAAPPATLRRLGALRYVLLLLLWVVGVGFGVESALLAEPFSHWMGPSPGVCAAVLAVWALLVSAVIPRFFCRFLCPTGAALSLPAWREGRGGLDPAAASSIAPDDAAVAAMHTSNHREQRP